jgi:transcriptional regulator with XRE-family HTH domain
LACEVSGMAESDFVERMRQAMKAQGISQAALARDAKITSQSAISNILAGTRRVRLNEQEEIERALGMTAETRVRWAPVIPIDAASDWTRAVQSPLRESPVGVDMAGAQAFVVEVAREEVAELLPEGGWAIVDPDQTSLFTGRLYLIVDQEKVAVRRYQGDPARFAALSGDPKDKPLKLDQSPFRVVGRVVSYGHDEG